MTGWDKPWPFNPAGDYPPNGATVEIQGATFTFIDGTLPGWRGPSPAAGYGRPFSDAGITLASEWARVNGVRVAP